MDSANEDVIREITDIKVNAFNANLNEKDELALKELTLRIKEQWPTVKLRIFGSKAKGGADEESDLDILMLLPSPVTAEIRRQIIHMIFNINLHYGSNISPFIVSEEEWCTAPLVLLPIHDYIEEESIPI